jgi:hypothetical protein
MRGCWSRNHEEDNDAKGKPEVIETSDDLEHLQKVYGPGLPVFDMRITNE